MFAAAQERRAVEPAHRARYGRLVELIERRRGCPDERVLELACGTGEGMVVLAERGFRVVGLDAAPGMVQRARTTVAACTAERAAVRRLNFNRPLPLASAAFDHALCVSALQLAADLAAVVAEMVRVVRPGGLILLATAACPRGGTSQPPGRSWTHRLLYAAKGAIERSGLVPGFDIAQLAELLRGAGASVIDTDVTDGLLVAVGQR